MAVTCTPASLAANVACLTCLNRDQLDGITTYLYEMYYEQAGPAPPVNFLLLETGDRILLEDGGRIGLE